MSWVAFYSQTGSEIKDLVLLGYKPDLIVTDNFMSYLINYDFFKACGIKQIARSIDGAKQNKIDQYNELLRDDDLVTLHGWLNIVPGDICEKYTIYNGHPGLITEYPELKGKDPQERTFRDLDKYKKVGSIVHRVIEEIDSGEIVTVAELEVDDRINSLDRVFRACGDCSIRAWVGFFRNINIILETELNLDGTFKNDRYIALPIAC